MEYKYKYIFYLKYCPTGNVAKPVTAPNWFAEVTGIGK